MRAIRSILLACMCILAASCTSRTRPSDPTPPSPPRESVAPAPAKELIVGMWDPVEVGKAGVMEFVKDGHWMASGGGFVQEGKYRFLDEELVQIDIKDPEEDKGSRTIKARVKVTKNEMTFTDAADKQKVSKFKRSPFSSPDSDVWSRPRGMIIGFWQRPLGPRGATQTVEFTRFGMVISEAPGAGGFTESPYVFVGDDQVQLSGEILFGVRDARQPYRMKVKVTKNELVLTSLGADKTEVKLSRKQ